MNNSPNNHSSSPASKSHQNSPHHKHNHSHNHHISPFHHHHHHISPSSTSNNDKLAHVNSNSNSPNNPHLLHPHSLALQQKQRSFLTFGFGAGSSGGASRRESHVNVNVTPTSQNDAPSDTPEIRKYKKRFNSEILCAALWGVNLLIGTENGLMLLDRSGQGKVSVQLATFSASHLINAHSLVQGVPINITSPLPTNGGARRTKHSRHDIRQEEPRSRLLFIMA